MNTRLKAVQLQHAHTDKCFLLLLIKSSAEAFTSSLRASLFVAACRSAGGKGFIGMQTENVSDRIIELIRFLSQSGNNSLPLQIIPGKSR